MDDGDYQLPSQDKGCEQRWIISESYKLHMHVSRFLSTLNFAI